MILGVILLVGGTAFASPQPRIADRHSEDTLRVMLLKLRRHHAWETREAIMGSPDDLRDAVNDETGAARQTLADRLPGMSPDPFDICRNLANCPQAPQSLHVEDDTTIDDAFLALARPWFNLQKARGKAVVLTVDPGIGVRLTLEDFPGLPFVTLEASPAPTGGFDVALDDGPEAAKAYAAERAAVLPAGPLTAR